LHSSEFYENLLDNIQSAVYVLDSEGNYVFVNSAYVQMLNMSKSEILSYNVRYFLETNQINVIVALKACKERRRVAMFQDVFDTLRRGRGDFRHLVVATPVFDETGEVKHIVAISRQLESINDDYNEASRSSEVSQFAAKAEFDIKMVDSSIIAESEPMLEVFRLASNIANADSAVLIYGESGTGKEVVAQYIHAESDRKSKSFSVINCAALPENLLEAELFGYEKGAFTGASSTGKLGLLESADGGTLFLDEINSLPLGMQGKLLRALETKTIQRIGSTKTRKVDFRLLVATNEKLEKLVIEKNFRADLYYRINVIPIHVPPLRERPEDIIPLTNHFLNVFCKKSNKNKTFSHQTLENMKKYNWPGNVRELKNFVERSVVMSYGNTIETLDIEAIASSGPDPIGMQARLPLINENPQGGFGGARFDKMMEQGVRLEDYIAECERRYLKAAMEKHKTTYALAEALGTSQTSIMRRKKKFGL